eukprot:GHVS01064568.1.p2 GENE.GHVS01064568.1~~GHVS01064568.1.p2  ORF type:complete len:158 (+),score=44.46 GHVS01064568.1:216-689(+)
MSGRGDDSGWTGGKRLSGISPNVTVEKVENVWGSTAGAGSDFFHIYRKHRYAEMDRLKQMDEDWDKKMEQDGLEAEKQRWKEVDEAVTAKKREKRKRKQAARQENRKKKAGAEKKEQSTQEEEEEEGLTIRVGHHTEQKVKGPMRPTAVDSTQESKS